MGLIDPAKPDWSTRHPHMGQYLVLVTVLYILLLLFHFAMKRIKSFKKEFAGLSNIYIQLILKLILSGRPVCSRGRTRTQCWVRG